METKERSLEEKLKDAHRALRTARVDLGRAIQRRDEANGYIATRRVKIDQLEAWAAGLQAQFDALKAESAEAILDEDHDSSTGE
jgi:hypothetical protein